MKRNLEEVLFSQVEGNTGMENPSSPTEKNQKGNEILVDDVKLFFTEDKVTGRHILEKAGKKPADCYSLYQKLKECDFEKIGLDEIVDISDKGIERFQIKEAEVVNYMVNDEPETTDKKVLTPIKILELAGIDHSKFYLVQLQPHEHEIVYAFTPEEPIKMVCGGMKFITREWIASVDIEEYGKSCKPAPPAKEYIIKVDKKKYPWPKPTITAKEVIGLEIKEPVENYILLKFYSNSPKPVQVPLNETIDLREKCLVRFVIQPKSQDDGKGIRRNFTLPEEDTDFLNKMGFHWEAHSEGNYMWLLIHDYEIPPGYNVETCTIALMIPPSYPATQIDMAYFFPQLSKKSGRAINALSNQTIDGNNYQRWSRHRKANEWKPGIDCISTHLTLVNNWILNDLNR